MADTDKERAERFLGPENIGQIVGHEPLTDEEKKLVKKLKEQENSDTILKDENVKVTRLPKRKKTVYYQQSRHGTWIFDDSQPIKSAYTLKDGKIPPIMLSTMVNFGRFMGNDKKIHNIEEDPLLFFTEYIPRVFGFSAKIMKVKNVDEVKMIMIKKAVESKTMEQISIKLPKNLIERFNEYAKTKSNPRSHFMREALVEYIERKEKNEKV